MDSTWKIFIRGIYRSFCKEITNDFPRIPVEGDFFAYDFLEYHVESVRFNLDLKEVEINVKLLSDVNRKTLC